MNSSDQTLLFYQDWAGENLCSSSTDGALAPRCGSIRPTLIIHGDSDVMVPFEVSSRRLAEEIPHNELEVYENASHGLFVSHKNQLNDDLLSFSRLRGTRGHD